MSSYITKTIYSTFRLLSWLALRLTGGLAKINVLLNYHFEGLEA